MEEPPSLGEGQYYPISYNSPLRRSVGPEIHAFEYCQVKISATTTKQMTATYNHTVLANMDIGSYLCSIDNTVLLYEHMIPNMQRKESDPVVYKQTRHMNKILT